MCLLSIFLHLLTNDNSQEHSHLPLLGFSVPVSMAIDSQSDDLQLLSLAIAQVQAFT